MEVQLEEEYEDKQKVLRDKRELECKLLNTQDQVLPTLCLWSLLALLIVCATCLDLKGLMSAVRGVTGLEGGVCIVIQVSQRDVEAEKRLKKDLKRTKVLLADAQIMLDHLKSNAPSKREIAQLKNQVSHSSKHYCISGDSGLRL